MAELNYTKGITIQSALKFSKVRTAYQDSQGLDVCSGCGSYYSVCPGELKEIQETVNDMYEALKRFLESSACTNNCDPDDLTCDTNFARKALAKAEGRQ